MPVFISVIGVAGFVVCLFVMYGTNHGIKAIRYYDEGFKLLDMRFRYNAETVYHTFDKIGPMGRRAYVHYLALDYGFILCFLIVMLLASLKVGATPLQKGTLVTLAGLRAALDIFENTLLLSLLRIYPAQNLLLADVCSWTTTLKFVLLYLWMLAIISLLLAAA